MAFKWGVNGSRYVADRCSDRGSSPSGGFCNTRNVWLDPAGKSHEELEFLFYKSFDEGRGMKKKTQPLCTCLAVSNYVFMAFSSTSSPTYVILITPLWGRLGWEPASFVSEWGAESASPPHFSSSYPTFLYIYFAYLLHFYSTVMKLLSVSQFLCRWSVFQALRKSGTAYLQHCGCIMCLHKSLI